MSKTVDKILDLKIWWKPIQALNRSFFSNIANNTPNLYLDVHLHSWLWATQTFQYYFADADLVCLMLLNNLLFEHCYVIFCKRQ